MRQVSAATPPRPPPGPPTRRLPGGVVRLGWISLFTDVASEMATPLIPLYLGALMAAPGFALGLIETQGFTAVFEAIDTACKAANVEVIGREKLGGGYITVLIKGDVAAGPPIAIARRQPTLSSE